MAEVDDFVRSLERELTCSICEDIFNEPKQLQCLHSFCLKCVLKWDETCRSRGQPLTCPSCRSREDGDVSKLRSSFYLDSLKQLLVAMRNRASKSDEKPELADCVSCQEHVKLVAFCPECEGMVCSECVDAHKKVKHLRDDHHVTMFSDLKQEHVNSYITNQFHCQEKFHEKHKLEYYCETCRKCICPKCSNTAHSTHDKTSIEDKAEEIKRVINQDLELINRLKEKFNKELELSQLNMIRIEKEINSAKKEVCDHVQAQMKVLQDHENITMKTLDKMYLDQKAANDEEQREINTSIQHLDTFTSEVKDQKLVHFILQNQLRCEELLQMQSVLKSKPNKRNTSVHYLPHTPVTQLLQKFGEIEENVTDPSRCSIKSLDDTIQCGVLGKFQIVTRNAKGQVCYTNEVSIDVKIKDEEGCEFENQVTKNPQKGRYTVTFKVEKPSTYHIQVNIGGKQITNSPVSIKAFEEKETIRRYRGILNKLTPQKFQTLMQQVLELEIDTADKLEEIINITFEKAITEPAFSVAIANICRCLVPTNVKEENEDGKDRTLTFRKILLNKCQKEFEKEKSDENRVREEMEQLLKLGLSDEELKLKKAVLEVENRKSRTRTLGNIRFIGELFKLKMLTENIMHDCIIKLIKNNDEDSFECLCTLLSTIGKDLDHPKAKPRMDQYFEHMKKVIDLKKASASCRFMLQDVMDLRSNNWVPR